MKNKKVLILCTGNSCWSIMAEALINSYFDNIQAFSSGTKATGKVNLNAKKVLQENGIWNENYHSKNLDEIINIDFDLVITVCDNAKNSCPTFPKKVSTIHIPFNDPDGKEYIYFKESFNDIKNILLPKIKQLNNGGVSYE